MKGRRPKPIKLHLLHGTFRKDRHGVARDLEPTEPGPMPSCPDWLRPEAQRQWGELAPELHALGLLTPLDVGPLAVLCTVMADVSELRRVREDLDPSMRRMLSQLELSQLKLLREFGMTPAAREEIRRRGGMNYTADRPQSEYP